MNVWPSELFPGVSDFLSTSLKERTIIMPHRSPAFSSVYAYTEQALKEFFHIPEEYKVFFTYSATDGMDILVNGVVDSKITHVSNWVFGDLFVQSSNTSWKDIKLLKNNSGTRVELLDIEVDSEVLVITSNETSTGIEYSSEEIQNIRSKFPDTILMVDATSSFWALKYDMSSADAWVLSVQKCLWLPSGLWLLIVNEKIINKALEREKAGEYIGWHNSLSKLNSFHNVYHTPSTPNILLIHGLQFIISAYVEYFGAIENLDMLTKKKASFMYSEMENIEGISVYNKWKGNSHTIIVLELTEEKMKEVQNKLLQDWWSVSPWLMDLAGKVIRIANFPVHTMKDFEDLIQLLK